MSKQDEEEEKKNGKKEEVIGSNKVRLSNRFKHQQVGISFLTSNISFIMYIHNKISDITQINKNTLLCYVYI